LSLRLEESPFGAGIEPPAGREASPRIFRFIEFIEFVGFVASVEFGWSFLSVWFVWSTWSVWFLWFVSSLWSVYGQKMTQKLSQGEGESVGPDHFGKCHP